MFEFLKQIADILVTVIGFVVNALEMLIQLFTAIPKALVYVITAVGYLPPFVSSIVFVSISIAVVLMIVNHGGD